MRKKLASLASSGFFRGLGAVSQVVLAWLVTQSLPKVEAGEFFVYLASFTVLSPLLLLGTQQFAMRELSRFDVDESGERRLAAHRLTKLSAQAVGAATAVLLTLAVLADQLPKPSWLADAPLADRLSVLVGAAAVASTALMVASHFHGLRRFSISLFFSHICIPLICGLLLLWLPATDAMRAIAYHALACLLTAVLACIAWGAAFGWPRFQRQSKQLEGALRASGNLWLVNCFVLIVNWFPIIIAGAVISSEDVAELTVSQRAANLINFILIIVNFAIAPKLRRSWATRDLLTLRQDISRCSWLLVSVGTPIFVGVVVFSPAIMSAFGSEYRAAALLLCIYAGGQYFNVITGSVNQILTMWNHERELRNICAISASTAIGLSIALGLMFGVVGIAAAAVAALCLQNVLAVVAVRKLLGFWVCDLRVPAELPQQV